MKLYLIKRCSDGAFFRSREAHYSLHVGKDKSAWSDTPQMMLRTPDGIVGNLRKLCSDPYCNKERPYRIGWKNFREEDLGMYEVICLHVDVLSMTATPAKDFIQTEKS